MKILLTVNDMSEYTGSAMSTYEMARVLSRDHDVTVCTPHDGWKDNELKRRLEELGVRCSLEWEQEYDLIIASHFCPREIKGFKINIVRGITNWEAPIPHSDAYVCIRPDIQEHLALYFNIPLDESHLVFNGVDRERFKPIKKSPRKYVKMVAPCNVDSLRVNWLTDAIVPILNKERQLHIYTQETKYKLPKSPYVHYHEPVFDMAPIIGDADVVVGIYLGRVNLEARSCEVPSIIYSPDEPYAAEPFEIDDRTFDELHNIENTVKYLLQIYDSR